jgi:hypothetical protein
LAIFVDVQKPRTHNLIMVYSCANNAAAGAGIVSDPKYAIRQQIIGENNYDECWCCFTPKLVYLRYGTHLLQKKSTFGEVRVCDGFNLCLMCAGR